jgi:hypothetical protein
MQASNRGAVTGRLAVTAALALAALAWPATAALANAAPVPARASRAAAWAIVPGPALAPNSALNGVAAVSSRLAWAAGIEGASSNGRVPGRPVIARWNGRSWSSVRLPSAWPGGLGLVAASSASDAWAFGQESSGTREHLLHWTGGRWNNVASPLSPGTLYGNLGLTAAPGGRAWLIASPVTSSLIFGWNGTRWSRQPYPCTATVCNIDQISARTGNAVWAVGNYVTPSATGGPLALHWTGRSWRQTSVPFVKFGYLTGVFARSGTDAWAVGAVFSTRTMLLYHWNGVAWRLVRTPAGLTAPSLGELTGITGDGAGHLWIYDFGPQMADRASYLHFDGRRWSLLQGGLIRGETRVIVRDVVVVPGTSAAWSVGLGFAAAIDARARIELYGSLAGGAHV